MVNESFAKLLCNNLCAVILSQVELGIEAEFWKDEKKECHDVLPMIPGRDNNKASSQTP